MVTFELRTSRGARILAFDDITRAQQEREKRQHHFGANRLELWRIRTIEEKVA